MQEGGRKAETGDVLDRLREEAARAEENINQETTQLLQDWPEVQKAYRAKEFVYGVRGREYRVPLSTESLSRTRIAKVVLPQFTDPGETYRWLREENVPGSFPFTAGVFPFRRSDEEPTRMFAGEGDPARTWFAFVAGARPDPCTIGPTIDDR